MWRVLVVATASAACRDAATYDTPAAKQRALAIANRRLTEIIRAGRPTHVIRTGLNGAETQIAYDAMLGRRSRPRVLAIAHVNNGLVPENARGYTRRGDPAFANFARRYLEAVAGAGAVARWKNFAPLCHGSGYAYREQDELLLQRGNFRPDGELVERSKGDAGTDRNVFEAEVLDPFRLAEMRDVPWPQALAGKRVLVVTSMARDVARQYERYRTDGVSWFGAAELLPPNMHLAVVASPVTYRGRAARGNWTRSLEELEKRVAAYQFDVALLSCGSYGLPLGHYTV